MELWAPTTYNKIGYPPFMIVGRIIWLVRSINHPHLVVNLCSDHWVGKMIIQKFHLLGPLSRENAHECSSRKMNVSACAQIRCQVTVVVTSTCALWVRGGAEQNSWKLSDHEAWKQLLIKKLLEFSIRSHEIWCRIGPCITLQPHTPWKPSEFNQRLISSSSIQHQAISFFQWFGA